MLLPFALFAATAAFYLLRVPSDVGWVDSGLYAVASVRFGLLHPPGSPLSVAAGHAACLLPWGTPAWRLGVLSAVAGASAVAVLFSVARDALSALRPQAPRAGVAACAAAAALSFGFSYSFASQAANAERFTLLMFFCLLALRFGLRLDGTLREKAVRGEFRIRRAALRNLVGVAASCVAAGGTHPIAFGLLAPFTILAFLHRRFVAWNAARVGSVCAAASVSFLLLYASLLAMARRDDSLAVGDPTGPLGLARHVLAYSVGYTGSFGPVTLPRDAYAVLARLFEFSAVSLTPLLLLLAAAGALSLARDGRRLLGLTSSWAAVTWLLNVWQPTANQESTLLPAQAVFAVWMAFGLADLAAFLASRLPAAGRTLAPWILPGVACLPLFAHASALDRARHAPSEEHARNLLTPLPRGAVLVSSIDYPAVQYLQSALGLRPDVAIVRTYYVLGMPWARAALVRRFPRLRLEGMEAALARDPGGATSALVRFVVDNADRFPLHVTHEVARALPLPAPYVFAPSGLTRAVVRSPPAVRPSAWAFGFRDPEFMLHAHGHRQIMVRMEYASVLSQYAEAHSAQAALLAAAGDAGAARAVQGRFALFDRGARAEVDELSSLYPSPAPRGPKPRFGISVSRP